MRALLLGLFLLGCDPGGWRVLDTEAPGRLEGVFVAAEDRILAVGDRGLIVVSDGDMSTVTSTDADIGPRMPGFFDAVETNGVQRFAGDDGTVLARPLDQPFVKERSGTFDRLLTMVAVTPTIIFAAGENGRAIRYRAGEDRWTQVNIRAGDARITGSWGISPEAMAFSTSDGRIIERVDGDWVATLIDSSTTSQPLPLFDVWSSTAGADVYAVGLSGGLFVRAAGDAEFEQIDVGVEADLLGIHGTGPDRVFAVGTLGTIVEWDGVEWNVVPSGTSADLFDVHATEDGKLVVAAGDDGTLVTLEE